jgi:hypothetical protein
MSDQPILEDAEKWAGLFFGVEALADLLRISADEIRIAIDDPESLLGQAIRDGRRLSEAELRNSILTLAKQGSGPAQSEAMRLLKSMDT